MSINIVISLIEKQSSSESDPSDWVIIAKKYLMRNWKKVAALIFSIIPMMIIFISSSTEAQEPNRPKLGENNIWFRDHNQDTVLIFIHGILSDSLTAWLDKSTDSYWPEIIRDHDDEMNKLDIYLAGYNSSACATDYDITAAADEVYDALKRRYSGHKSPLEKKNMIIVGHSTGGIIARYILTQHRDDFKEKTVGLLLFASPSAGTADANRLSALNKYCQNKITPQLEVGSQFLRQLDINFKDYRESHPGTTLLGQEYVETRFITRNPLGIAARLMSGDEITIVPRESGGRYFGSPRQIPDSEHSSIVKPKSDSDPSYYALKDFYVQRFSEEVKRADENRVKQLAEAKQMQNSAFHMAEVGDLGAAEDGFAKAIAKCDETQIKTCDADVLLSQARVQRIYSKEQAAKAALRKARDIFSSSANELGLTKCLVLEAEIDEQEGNNELANEHINEAISILEKDKLDYVELARSYAIFVDVIQQTDGEQKINDVLDKADATLRKVQIDQSEQAVFTIISRLSMARVKMLIRSKDMDGARRELNKAEQNCQLASSWNCHAITLVGEAHLADELNKHDDALQFIRMARGIFTRMNQWVAVGGTYIFEGLLYCKTEVTRAIGNFDRAYYTFQQAQEMRGLGEAEELINQGCK